VGISRGLGAGAGVDVDGAAWVGDRAETWGGDDIVAGAGAGACEGSLSASLAFSLAASSLEIRAAWESLPGYIDLGFGLGVGRGRSEEEPEPSMAASGCSETEGGIVGATEPGRGTRAFGFGAATGLASTEGAVPGEGAGARAGRGTPPCGGCEATKGGVARGTLGGGGLVVGAGGRTLGDETALLK